MRCDLLACRCEFQKTAKRRFKPMRNSQEDCDVSTGKLLAIQSILAEPKLKLPIPAYVSGAVKRNYKT